jgi:hypothetical protein
MENTKNKNTFPFKGLSREEFIDGVIDRFEVSGRDIYSRMKDELDALSDEELEDYGFDPEENDREEFIEDYVDNYVSNVSAKDLYWSFREDYKMDELSDEELIKEFKSYLYEDDEDEE